jgi:hydrogenase/urease accessory protein HupE
VFFKKLSWLLAVLFLSLPVPVLAHNQPMGASRWAIGKNSILGFIDLDAPQLSLIKGMAEGHYDLSSATAGQLQHIAKEILQPYIAQKLSLSVNGKVIPFHVVQLARGDGDRYTISLSAAPVFFNQPVNKVRISYSLLQAETDNQHLNIAFGYVTDATGADLQQVFNIRQPSFSTTFDASTAVWEFPIEGGATAGQVTAAKATSPAASGAQNVGSQTGGVEEAPRLAAVQSAPGAAAATVAQEKTPGQDSPLLAAPSAAAPALPPASGEQTGGSSAPAGWETRVWNALRQFVPLGIEHILTGYDHIAFLLAIIVMELSIKQILKIITAFTVAHSCTLLLAALEIVKVNSRLVESCIAFSICYVAVENLIKTKSDYRWAIAFGFGLIHGFGFASALRELILGKANLLLSVVSFNLGVELGQLMLIFCMLPVLYFLKRQIGSRLVTAGASTAVFAVGFAWFLERVFLLKLLWF